MSGWTDAELDGFAVHVHFEVTMLVEQVDLLIETTGGVWPIGSSTDAEGQAVLEASLVHLRLLDDFLGDRRKHPRDVHARDWISGWRGQPWLGRDVRGRIDAQVAHLSQLRVDWQEWDLPPYARACCDELVRFFGEIADPGRLEAFFDAPEIAATARSRFAR